EEAGISGCDENVAIAAIHESRRRGRNAGARVMLPEQLAGACVIRIEVTVKHSGKDDRFFFLRPTRLRVVHDQRAAIGRQIEVMTPVEYPGPNVDRAEPAAIGPGQSRERAAEIELAANEDRFLVGAPFAALIAAWNVESVGRGIVRGSVVLDAAIGVRTRVVSSLDLRLRVLIELVTHRRVADEVAVLGIQDPEIPGL